MNAVKNDVVELAKKELAYSMTKFPLFAGTHEGYGVLREEYEETFDEVVNMQSALALFWDGVKKNHPEIQLVGIQKLYDASICTAIEAIQVAAMCLKHGRSMDELNSGTINSTAGDARDSASEHGTTI